MHEWLQVDCKFVRGCSGFKLIAGAALTLESLFKYSDFFLLGHDVKMIDRNIYKEDVDFAALALRFPAFNKQYAISPALVDSILTRPQ